MRQRRLLVVSAIAAGLWAPRAEAALCEAPGPYLGTGPRLPLGCPVYVYWEQGGGTPPKVTVLRSGAYANATGSSIEELKSLVVNESVFDCRSRISNSMTTFRSYLRSTIQVTGVGVGDQIGIGIGWFGGIEIVAAGACELATEPRIDCSFTPQCFEPTPIDENNGCAAGPGGGLLLGLALLGLRRRR